MYLYCITARGDVCVCVHGGSSRAEDSDELTFAISDEYWKKDLRNKLQEQKSWNSVSVETKQKNKTVETIHKSVLKAF